MRRAGPAALLLVACASSPATPAGPGNQTAFFMDGTAPPIPAAMPNHTLVSVKDSIVGPSVPELKARQGQAPLVHVAFDTDTAGQLEPTVGSRRATFEVAVFPDGLLAFDGGACAKTDDLAIRRLDAERLSVLRSAIDDFCPQIARLTGGDCSHGDELAIACSKGDSYGFTARLLRRRGR